MSPSMLRFLAGLIFCAFLAVPVVGRAEIAFDGPPRTALPGEYTGTASAPQPNSPAPLPNAMERQVEGSLHSARAAVAPGETITIVLRQNIREPWNT